MKSNTRHITEELKQLSREVAPCMHCASCAASCPVFQTLSERNPRHVITRLAAGDFEDILESEDFWWCGVCYSCEAHCPQGVPLSHIFLELKRLAIQSGRPVPKRFLKIGQRLSQGTMHPHGPELIRKRKQQDLPQLAEPDLHEIEIILKIA